MRFQLYRVKNNNKTCLSFISEYQWLTSIGCFLLIFPVKAVDLCELFTPSCPLPTRRNCSLRGLNRVRGRLSLPRAGKEPASFAIPLRPCIPWWCQTLQVPGPKEQALLVQPWALSPAPSPKRPLSGPSSSSAVSTHVLPSPGWASSPRLGKIYANHLSDNRFISTIYQEPLQFNKKTDNPIKKWGKYLNSYFTKEDIQMADKHMKRCSTQLIIMDMGIRAPLRCHVISTRLAIIKRDNTKYTEKLKPSYIAGENRKWDCILGNNFDSL